MQVRRVDETEVGSPDAIFHQCEATWGLYCQPAMPTTQMSGRAQSSNDPVQGVAARIDLVRRRRQRRPEPKRALAAAESDDVLLTPERGEHRVSKLACPKVDRGDEAAPAGVGDDFRP